MSDAETITDATSWRQLSSVDRWAQACHDTAPEYCEARVRNMDSQRHLRAALDVEVSRSSPRQERVALLNQRLAEVRDDA